MATQPLPRWPVPRRSRPPLRRVAIIIVAFSAMLVVMLAYHQNARAASAFVSHNGTQFVVNGAPFQVVGSNNYYPVFEPKVMVDDLFANAQAMGLNTMRIWAFTDIGSLDGTTVKSIDGKKGNEYLQYWDTTTNTPQINLGADGIQMLDYAVASAKAHNIRLVLPLTNNWKDFGGMDQYNIWYGLTTHDAFYTNANTQAAYKNYARTLINHVNALTGLAYKDDPTIMTWELANEPRCAGSTTSASSSCTTATLTSWANTMSTYIKSLDPNHLVSVGDEGFINNGSSDYMYSGNAGVDDNQLAALPNIDYVTYHMYTQDWNETFAWATKWINDHILLADAAGKPAVLEEFGVKNDPTSRTTYYNQWLNQICAQDSNWSFWILSARTVDTNGNLAGLYPDYDGYTIWYHDASGNITADGSMMATQAAKYNSGKCTGVPTPTPTLIPTTTPLPPVTNGALQVAIQQNGLDNTQESDMNVRVTNTSASAVSNVAFRLYFTLDGHEALSNYSIDRYGDYFTGGGSGTSTATGPTANAYTDGYYTISLGSASLPAGATWTWNGRLRLTNWATDYSAANDWWHTIFPTAFANTQYVPGYVNGVINWGQAPGVIGNPGTPQPTATATHVTTPTPTSTVPTATPVKPTPTTIPPTATPIPPTPTSSPGGNGVTASGVVASSSPYYSEEDVKFSNTASITALTITITVQKTTGVSYNGMYTTFGGATTTHVDNGSTITYTYTLTAGQSISPSTNLLAAAQFGGTGTAHATGGDTWSITTTSGGKTATTGGHF